MWKNMFITCMTMIMRSGTAACHGSSTITTSRTNVVNECIVSIGTEIGGMVVLSHL